MKVLGVQKKKKFTVTFEYKLEVNDLEYFSIYSLIHPSQLVCAISCGKSAFLYIAHLNISLCLCVLSITYLTCVSCQGHNSSLAEDIELTFCPSPKKIHIPTPPENIINTQLMMMSFNQLVSYRQLFFLDTWAEIHKTLLG